MKKIFFNIIGTMTGTSMDGIDISLVRTNGEILIRMNKNYFATASSPTKGLLGADRILHSFVFIFFPGPFLM